MVNRKYVLIFIVIMCIGYISFLIYKSSQKEKTIESNQEDSIENEIIKDTDDPDYLNDGITMSIISPEEEFFSVGQARLWKAEIEGMTVDNSFGVDCTWEFYFDKDSDDIYKQMNTRSSISKESPDLCTFTSTFIDRTGKVRAKLTANIKDNNGVIFKTFTAEREYIVE